MQPYIGVSAVMNPEDALAVLKMLPAHTTRQLMIGTVASERTLKGQTNSWPNRFPVVARMRDIFPEDPRALNLIHDATRNDWTLAAQLGRLVELTGQHLSGFQLNLPWPNPDELQRFKRSHPPLVLVTQLSPRNLEHVGGSLRTVTKKFCNIYEGIADGILIDMSRGKGVPLDPERTLELLEMNLEIRERLSHPLGIGTAGGYGPETMHLLDPRFVELVPDMSLDAENQLRKDDHLHLPFVQDYINKGLKRVERTHEKS